MNIVAQPRSLRLRSGALSLSRVRIVGILNVTPDSFYDGGRCASLDAVRARAREMAAEGADVIEVGGEKAGPGPHVSLEDELRRVIPAVRAVRDGTALPVAVDTLKPEVAAGAVEAGADIINSIGGFDDPAMRRVARETGAAVVVMHIQGQPRVPNPAPHYEDVVAEVRAHLASRAALCVDDGISPDRIVVDPGSGFGKTTDLDLEVIRHLDALTSLPFPLLLAVSRKKLIGDVIGGGPEDRLEGSLAIAAWGVLKGVGMVRAHDVRASRRVCTMIESVFNPELVEERGR